MTISRLFISIICLFSMFACITNKNLSNKKNEKRSISQGRLKNKEKTGNKNDQNYSKILAQKNEESKNRLTSKETSNIFRMMNTFS